MEQVDKTKYSNLTEAILNGEPIDFRKLEGRKSLLLNYYGAVSHEVVLSKYSNDFPPYDPRAYVAWDCDTNVNTVYKLVLTKSWCGINGYSLWIYGDIPLIPEKAPRLVDYRDTINGELTDEDLKNLDGKTVYLSHPEHGNLKVKLVYKNQTSGITVDTEVGRYPLHILLTYAYTNDKGWKLLVEENND